MKPRLVLLLLSLLIPSLLMLCAEEQKQLDYSVEGCGNTKYYSNSGYELTDKTLTAYVMRNCCSDEIKVENTGEGYRIVEIDKDGKICKCNCMSKVEIRNVEGKDVKVIFVDFGGKESMLGKLNQFCGWSTYAECKSDADCVKAGCSGQVCAGRGEEISTTCEWKFCYDSAEFGMKCGCYDGKCQWAQS